MASRHWSWWMAGVFCLVLTTAALAKTAKQYFQEARTTRDPAKLTQIYSLAIAAGIQDKTMLAEAYYRRGCAFFHLTRPALALEDFDQAIKINPRAAVYYQARGLAYQKLNKAGPAAENFRLARSVGAGRPRRTPCDRAAPAKPAPSPPPAAPPLTAVRPSPPAPPPQAKPPAAAPVKPALSERQKKAALALAKGIVAAQQGRLRAAHRLLSRALRLGLPTARQKFQAYFHRGKIRLLLRRRTQALSDLSLAVRLSPHSASAHYYRGHVYYDMRLYRQAVAAYTRAIRLNPRMARAYIGRGMAHQDMGRYQSAVADYTRAIRLRPRHAAGYNLRGMSYLSLRRYPEARRNFDAALRLKPGNPHILGNRGLVFYRLHQYQRALQDYNQALARAPKSPVVLNNRGLVFMALRRFGEAVSDFTRAIRYNPRDPISHLNRGDARLLTRQYRSAIDDYTRALALLPGGGELSLARVSGYRRSGRRGDVGGSRISRNVVFYNVRRARITAYKHRAVAYQRLGMYARARADMERARMLQGR